jgi:hypothetical protein
MIEQNRLLIKFVAATGKKTAEPHGNETPWKVCTACHWDEAVQGSLMVNRSTGHSRHVFMESLACKSCHGGLVHAFRPDWKACLHCHEGWEIHGSGEEKISCLRCHAFSSKKQEAFIPDREQCLSCHRKYSNTSFPNRVPMARLNCYECHKPHVRSMPTDEACLRCHTHEVLMLRPVHKSDKQCTSCHKPHRWSTR